MIDSEITDISGFLNRIERGDQNVADDLFSVVYKELRGLAAAKLRHERKDHTLTPTALVHEVWLKLARKVDGEHWAGKTHFFNAAAEAMRRLLIDHARRKKAVKRGGAEAKQEHLDGLLSSEKLDELLVVDEALTRLENEDSDAAQLVKLRFFAGLTNKQAAQAMHVSPRKANMLWAYARAWLKTDLSDE